MRSSPVAAGVVLAAAIAWIADFVATHTTIVVITAATVIAAGVALPLLLAWPLVKRTATPLVDGTRPEPTKSQETATYAAPGQSR